MENFEGGKRRNYKILKSHKKFCFFLSAGGETSFPRAEFKKQKNKKKKGSYALDVGLFFPTKGLQKFL